MQLQIYHPSFLQGWFLHKRKAESEISKVNNPGKENVNEELGNK